MRDGGVLTEWAVLGRFAPPATVDSVAQALDIDYLRASGGESRAVFRFGSAVGVATDQGKEITLDPRRVQADSAGVIDLGTGMSGSRFGVSYAFCIIESFIDCRVRCFVGSRGAVCVWVNGERLLHRREVSDTCVPLGFCFDSPLVQGHNRVLAKVAGSAGALRLCFEVYEMRDTLAPYLNHVDTLMLDMAALEVSASPPRIRGALLCNVPAPSHLFDATVSVTVPTLGAQAREPIVTTTVYVGREFELTLPDSCAGRGPVQVRARMKFGPGKSLAAVRPVWLGSVGMEFEALKARVAKLLGGAQGRIDGRNFSGRRDGRIALLLSGGALDWCSDFLGRPQEHASDAWLRQLSYCRENCDLAEHLLAGGTVPSRVSYPVLLRVDGIPDEDSGHAYDPAQWLEYKYPEQFQGYGQEAGEGYRCWIYLPEKTGTRKRPLLLSLHGFALRGRDIDRVRTFGPGGYALSVPEFPFLVLTPQCGERSLWHGPTLRALVEVFAECEAADWRRISVTGQDMGAFAAWNQVCSYPSLFAAAVPLGGGGDDRKACAASGVAVWAFRGGRDNLVPSEVSQKIVDAVRKCGMRVLELSVYDESDHDLAEVVYGKARLYKWLESRRK